MFGDSYLGTYPADVFVKEILPTMKNGQLVVCNIDNSDNKGKHWILFLKDNNKLYGYDSYGQDIRNYNTHFKKLKIHQDFEDGEQKLEPYEKNCGQRSLGAGLMYKKYGVKKFLKI